MKKTYFLDKIFNANHFCFDEIMQTIVEDLCQEQYPYTYFKKGNKWLLEIERENDLISVLFDDYTMQTHNSLKKISAEYSNHWRNIFLKFLHKNQKYLYNKNLNKMQENFENQHNQIDQEKLNSYIGL